MDNEKTSASQPINFIRLEDFLKGMKALRKKYPSIDSDLEGLLRKLEAAPHSGEPLGKDCYKIRLAISSKGQGKSGGARVITCVKILASNIYLLTIYDKSERDTISENELTQLVRIALEEE